MTWLRHNTEAISAYTPMYPVAFLGVGDALPKSATAYLGSSVTPQTSTGFGITCTGRLKTTKNLPTFEVTKFSAFSSEVMYVADHHDA